jgi:hypothetical protein
MPEYLNFESEVLDLSEDELVKKLEIQFLLFQQALGQLKEQERATPGMFEKVVSV